MKYLLLITALLIAPTVLAQNAGEIAGVVLDKEMNNEPLLFANIQLKNIARQTQSNFNGNFYFEDLEEGSYTLIVSYAGYQSIEMPIVVEEGIRIQLELGLAAKTFELGDVAGLSTESKENLTTAAGLD